MTSAMSNTITVPLGFIITTVSFEEVVLDQHPEEIQALMDTCGFMGVPCTHITLDDGTEEHSHVLGLA